MNSRDQILKDIKANKGPLVPLPEVPVFESGDVNKLELFAGVVESGGGKVETQIDDWESWLRQRFPNAKRVISMVTDIEGTESIDLKSIPSELKSVDVAIIQGQLGVAENGAIWIDERNLGQRVLPFIAQHLVIFLQKDTLVSNMHEAYDRIKIDETGFGVFIAGPSKTADIEQSLVIGAQGARSLTVFIHP